MKEFRSELEKVIATEELLFHPTPGFGRYSKFLSHAIAHPAKMNTKLLEFLIKNFTKEGETVLDPMCGSGSTGVIAALCGRNAIQVDIEGKFVAWAEEAKQKVEKQAILTPKGWIRNVLGDTRKLSQLLKEADVVVTSPPYSETLSTQAGGGSKKGIEGKSKIHEEKRLTKPYSLDNKQIGNLPHGNVDAVIMSPPYGEAQDGHGIAKEGYRGKKHSPTDLVGNRSYMPNKFESPENISKLPLGNVDAVITSPPYEGSLEATSRHTKGGIASRDKKLAQTGTYADVVITSPPYGDTNNRKGRKMDDVRGVKGRAFDLPENKENIGNLKEETYLEAMLKVYSEMWKVLKPDGLCIIVIKPFIRNKRVVDLPWHTWLLLEKVGFKLEKLFKLRLKQESFWRVLYRKKYPHVPTINHEYILVVKVTS